MYDLMLEDAQTKPRTAGTILVRTPSVEGEDPCAAVLLIICAGEDIKPLHEAALSGASIVEMTEKAREVGAQLYFIHWSEAQHLAHGMLGRTLDCRAMEAGHPPMIDKQSADCGE